MSPTIILILSLYWCDYGSYKHKHCYQKGDVIVTWAYGHIMMTAMPEAYGKEYADFSKYPVIPSTWKKRPSPSTKEQFEYIRSILAKADIMVNGGDPDREGQLLIDEILEYVGYKGEVRRILINAKDTDSLKRAVFSGANVQNKPAAAVAICRRGGATAAYQTLNVIFEMMNMPVVTSQYWNIAYGLAPGEVMQDTEGMQTMRTLADNMAWLLKKIHADGNPDYLEREDWQCMNFIR